MVKPKSIRNIDKPEGTIQKQNMNLDLPDNKCPKPKRPLPTKAKTSAGLTPLAHTPAKPEVCARASITIETPRWSKIDEVLASLKTGVEIRVEVEKHLLRKRVRISMDGPAAKVDEIIQKIQALG